MIWHKSGIPPPNLNNNLMTAVTDWSRVVMWQAEPLFDRSGVGLEY